MRIEQFEDIETWRLARELTHKVYGLTKKTKFAPDFGLKGQIQDAAGLPRKMRSLFNWGSSKGFRGQGSGLVKVKKKEKQP